MMYQEHVLENEFLVAAPKRSRFLAANQAKLANREYDKLHRIKDKMRGLPDRGEAALKRISSNSDPEVQIVAAAALLAVDEAFAVELLERVHKSEGTGSLDAEMTLREWRSGALRDHWF